MIHCINLDRLTGVTYHDSDSEAFGKDDLGNRDGNQTLRDAGTVNFLVNDDTNRYTSIGGNTITHDAAGNLTCDRQNYRYEYDYENRIVRIYKLSGQSQITVASFDYDALGHRVRKIDAVASQTTLYYNDPEWRVLAEYDGTGTLQRTCVWGNYIDEALRMRAGESDYYTLHDHLYSPAALIGYENNQWRPVERYEFDAYGTTHIMDPSFGSRTATQYGVTTLFTGRTLDALDSGALKIMYYRNRYTDSFAGRFLQQDPIGYVGALDLYLYVGDRPTVFIDPDGMLPYSPNRIIPIIIPMPMPLPRPIPMPVLAPPISTPIPQPIPTPPPPPVAYPMPGPLPSPVNEPSERFFPGACDAWKNKGPLKPGYWSVGSCQDINIIGAIGSGVGAGQAAGLLPSLGLIDAIFTFADEAGLSIAQQSCNFSMSKNAPQNPAAEGMKCKIMEWYSQECKRSCNCFSSGGTKVPFNQTKTRKGLRVRFGTIYDFKMNRDDLRCIPDQYTPEEGRLGELGAVREKMSCSYLNLQPGQKPRKPL